VGGGSRMEDTNGDGEIDRMIVVEDLDMNLRGGNVVLSF